MKKLIYAILLVAFVSNTVIPPSFAGQMIALPQPGAMVTPTSAFVPAHLMGLTIDPVNALKFDFLIHKGEVPLTDDEKRVEYRELIKYFLAALTVPNNDQWVNLSPYEGQRMIKDNFGKTEMGRDLLAQDYLLKQVTASLMHPDSELGKQFWAGVYEQAWQKYGSTDVPVDTFNKVWIIPDNVSVFEKDNTALVVNSHLKVMTERDYVATENNSLTREVGSIAEASESAQISAEIVRDIILPAIEKEVNEGKTFANLRQIYGAMILATWFKQQLKESILGKAYADHSALKGVDQDPKNNDAIYEQYLAAYKKGVVNLIRDDEDKYSQEVIPRKYFSGGLEAPKKVDAASVSQLVAAGIPGDFAENEVDRTSTVLAGEATSRDLDADAAQGAQFEVISRAPNVVQYAVLGDLMRNEDFLSQLALRVNAAYYEKIAQEPIPVVDLQGMEKEARRVFVGQNVAPFYALANAVEQISAESNESLLAVMGKIARGEIDKTDPRMRMVASFAHATWQESLFLKDIARAKKPNSIPLKLLSLGEVEKDFIVIEAIATFVLDSMSSGIVEGYTAEEIEALVAEERTLIGVMVASGGLSEAEIPSVHKAFLTTMYAHRFEDRKFTGRPYAGHLLRTSWYNRMLFGNRDTWSDRVALSHDMREDEEAFYNLLKNYVYQNLAIMEGRSRQGGQVLADDLIKTQSALAAKQRLAVRMLSKLGAEESAGIADPVAEYYGRLMDPQKYYPVREGSAWYTPAFIRQVSLVKLSDILANLNDLKEGVDVDPLAGTAFAVKFMEKILAKAVPGFVLPTKYLKNADKQRFISEAVRIMEQNTALQGEQYEGFRTAAQRMKEGLGRLALGQDTPLNVDAAEKASELGGDDDWFLSLDDFRELHPPAPPPTAAEIAVEQALHERASDMNETLRGASASTAGEMNFLSLDDYRDLHPAPRPQTEVEKEAQREFHERISDFNSNFTDAAEAGVSGGLSLSQKKEASELIRRGLKEDLYDYGYDSKVEGSLDRAWKGVRDGLREIIAKFTDSSVREYYLENVNNIRVQALKRGELSVPLNELGIISDDDWSIRLEADDFIRRRGGSLDYPTTRGPKTYNEVIAALREEYQNQGKDVNDSQVEQRIAAVAEKIAEQEFGPGNSPENDKDGVLANPVNEPIISEPRLVEPKSKTSGVITRNGKKIGSDQFVSFTPLPKPTKISQWDIPTSIEGNSLTDVQRNRLAENINRGMDFRSMMGNIKNQISFDDYAARARRTLDDNRRYNNLIAQVGKIDNFEVFIKQFNGEVVNGELVFLGVEGEEKSEKGNFNIVAADSIQRQGGIDFNEQYLKMNIKSDGNGVPLPINQQDLDNIQIDGLVPVILNIVPVTSLPILSAAESSGTPSSVS